jgi:hypothetical protein
MPDTIRHCGRCAAALFVMLAPLAGHAQTSPYYLGVSQTFGYDSNIFRLPDRTEVAQPGGGVTVIEPESSGLISTTLLLAGLDQPIGRQRVYGNLSAGYSSYSNQSQLNSPRYALTAGVDWDTVNKLSGNAEFTSGLRLGTYGDRDVPTGLGDNEETYNRLKLLGRLGDWERSRFWFEAGYVFDQVRNDIEFERAVPFSVEADPVTGAPFLRFTDGYKRDDRSSAFTLGVRHRWSGALVMGAGVRTESRSEEVERRLIDPAGSVSSTLDSRRNDFDLFANLNSSEGNDLSARLSYGNRDYDNPGVLDTSGWSGSLRWGWRPTAKVDSSLRLLYDTEDREEGGASAASSAGDDETLAVEWRLRYEISAKLAADVSASWYRRDYDYGGGFTDDDTNFQLALSWAALRNTTVGCALGFDRRDSSYQGPLSGRSSYDAITTSCYAQVMLR